MLKKSLFVVALALMVGTGYARDYVTPEGSLVDWEYDGNHSERKAESYNWPAEFLFQDICYIPVEMDIGFWVKIVDCKKKVIELAQVEIHKYTGCVEITVQTNVNVQFACSISKAKIEGTEDPKVPGDYSCSVSPSDIDAPGGKINVCATIKDADITKLAGGTNNVKVATVTLKVRPRVAPKLCA